jgi:hypothetical protein
MTVAFALRTAALRIALRIAVARRRLLGRKSGYRSDFLGYRACTGGLS